MRICRALPSRMLSLNWAARSTRMIFQRERERQGEGEREREGGCVCERERERETPGPHASAARGDLVSSK